MTRPVLSGSEVVDFQLRIHRRWIVAAVLSLAGCSLYLSVMPMANTAQVSVTAAHDVRIRFAGLQLPRVEPGDTIGLTTSVGSFSGSVTDSSAIPNSNATEVTILLDEDRSPLPEPGSPSIASFPEQSFMQILVQRR